VKGIADTGFIVAFVSQADAHHAWATDVARRISEPLLTCESVLSESAFHLGSSSHVLGLVEGGMLQLRFNAAEHVTALARLAAKYADRRPDFADLCLIRLSELYPRHPVLTTDAADFRVYRRHQREAIPLLVPPSLR
jgi:predicted nucleic acid-binding protein